MFSNKTNGFSACFCPAVSEVKCPETEDLDYMLKHYYTLKTYLKLNTNSFNPSRYKKSHNPTVAQGWKPSLGFLFFFLIFRKDFDYDRKSLICFTGRGIYYIELARPKSGAPLLLLELIYFLK